MRPASSSAMILSVSSSYSSPGPGQPELVRSFWTSPISATGAEIERALALGANAYITKPIQAPQVIAKVKELLKIEA